MSDLRFRSLEEYRELHEDRIKKLEEFVEELGISINHHGDRLHALEEKERASAREEHERDVS